MFRQLFAGVECAVSTVITGGYYNQGDIKSCNFNAISALLRSYDGNPGYIAGFGATAEGPLSFALSKMMNEIQGLVTTGKRFDDGFAPHLKVKTFLVIYDFCKNKLGEGFVQRFNDEMLHPMFDRSDKIKDANLQACKGLVELTIKDLVANYKHNLDDLWEINLPGYNVDANNALHAEEGKIAKIVIKSNGTLESSTEVDSVPSEASPTDDADLLAAAVELSLTTQDPVVPDPDATTTEEAKLAGGVPDEQ